MRASVRSVAATQGIEVIATANYMPQHSQPASRRYVFAYTIRISNKSQRTVQLTSRHWHIMHGDGKTQEVEGEGVVGEQPILPPGQSFQYTSGCVLTTPHGTMHGTYRMLWEQGDGFDAEIAPLTLAAPYALN
ncbi:MAG: Co2+/Mg2+ efflux protein ApaG [Proteobacteria bacterium]|nr:Co2+/Mg2+ efflux protein ApaG [Pseudomonadota bacterium]